MYCDENTWKPIRCPFCEAEGNCPHLLLEYDRSFNSCENGVACSFFDEATEMILGAFNEARQSGGFPKWKDMYVSELWDQFQSELAEYGEAELASGAFGDLMEDVLFEAGGLPIVGVPCEDVPGLSSAMLIMYEQDPQEIVTEARAAIRKRLVACGG